MTKTDKQSKNIVDDISARDERDGGTVVAIDTDVLYYLYNRNGQSVKNSEQQFIDYIGDYVNKGITDVTISVFEQTSLVPSLKWTWLGSKIDWTSENGVTVDYSDDPFIKPAHAYYTFGNCEPIEVMIRECKANGINPWITFRMNDAHYHGDRTSYIRGTEYYKFNGEGYMVYGNTNAYFDTCFNFENKEVREHYLSFLKEIIERYDAYGFELDFIREIFCFEYWKNTPSHYCEIMTNFISEIKKIIRNKEKNVGRHIPLMIRVTKDIENSIKFGFDVASLIKNKLVDVIVPSPRIINDSRIDIAGWVELTRGTNVKVYAGQELNNSSKWGVNPNTVETAKGYASVAYGEGAEKIYLSNFFTTAEIRFYDHWEGVSSKKKASSGVRRHILPLSEEVEYVPWGGNSSKCALPVILKSDETIGIKVSLINECDKTTIYCRLQTNTGIAAPTLKLNGMKADFLDDVDGMYYQNGVGRPFAYTISDKKIPTGLANISFTTEDGSPIKVLYLEIKVENNGK